MAESLGTDVIFDFLQSEMVFYFESVLNLKNGSGNGTSTYSMLEALGYNVGYSFIERLTAQSARFKDELDTMKFICKEFWMALYRKQIDNLRTNHQGVYVLQDNNLRFLSRLSRQEDSVREAEKFLAFPCGLIRGALTNIGYESTVAADITTLPAC